jgi:asparagine synthase (glutamine-hydrolysing)
VWRDVPDPVLRARKAPFRAPVEWFGIDDADLAPAAIAEAGLVDPRGVDRLRPLARQGDVGAAERLFNLQVLHTWHRAWYRRDQRAAG